MLKFVLKYAPSLAFANSVFSTFSSVNDSSFMLILVAFGKMTPVLLYKSFVTIDEFKSGLIKFGDSIPILLLSVSLITPNSNGLTPYSANILLTFAKFCAFDTAAFSHNMFLPESMYSLIAFVAISSKSLFGVVITNVAQSSGIFPVVNISKLDTSITSFCINIFNRFMLFFNVSSLYPSEKYTFGTSFAVTERIELVSFCSAMLIVSYVLVSYVTKSFAVSTFDFSPHSTIIPCVPLSIPYLVARSGLVLISIASAMIFSFSFLYCFARL